MGEKKTTVMILKVDLKCERCYKRVKKVLCEIPQIRDRIFDEKSNTVMIKVFCCDPEKIRYKLCNKGRGSIKSIEIKEPEQPKPAENPKPDPPKQTEAPPPAPKPVSPNNPPPAKSPEPGHNPAPKPPVPAQKPSDPVQNQPKPPTPQPASAPKPTNSEPRPAQPMPLYGSEPIPTCCEQCYGGRSGGPCNYGYGPQSGYYDAYYYGRVGYNAYGPPAGPSRLCHPGRCAEYFSEENPDGCYVM